MKDNRPTQPGSSGTQRQHELQRISALAQAGRWDEAIAGTERWLKPGSRDAQFMRVRAVLEDRARRFVAAVYWATSAESIESHPDTLSILARGEADSGKTDAALARYRRILELVPGDIGTRLLMAQALESAVRVDEARELVEALLRDVRGKSPSIEARVHHLRAALLVHERRGGEAVELLDQELLGSGSLGSGSLGSGSLGTGSQGTGVLEAGTHSMGERQPTSSDWLRRAALYLRAKACDRLKRYDEAWESAAKANEIGAPQFDPATYTDGVGALMHHWTRATMRDFPSSRSASEVPVFIAGMPRSGTSLLDQIIDAHARAAGVGEMSVIEHFARELERVWDASLPAPESFGPMRDRAFRNAAAAYVSMCGREAPGATRVVNKALGNNRVVGLLSRLFPKTRIIHAIRDPRDVAVSCFMGGFNNDYYPWTARAEWISVAWQQSRRLMEHWKRETDLPILDVRYEEVVSDPGAQFPRFIEFLGLPWDDGCTRFHESKRTVRTLSYDQVNRPLYASSVQRWQRYEKFLRGVDWPSYA